MGDEARNVEILKTAYTRWSDTKGESVDDWLKICADNIDFACSIIEKAARDKAIRPDRVDRYV